MNSFTGIFQQCFKSPPCSPMYWIKPPLSNPPCSQHLWENLAKIPLSVHCNNQECLTSTRKAKVTKCYFCIKTWLFTHFIYIILISDLAWHASIHYGENSKPKYTRFWVLLRKIYFLKMSAFGAELMIVSLNFHLLTESSEILPDATKI